MNITNILIVQFSTRAPVWEKAAFNNDESLRDEWFEFRANLFNKGLAQCLIHQTKQVSKVYLIMDENDTQLYEQFLQSNTYIPIYAGPSMPYFIKTIENDLAASGIDEDYLVSRIDSDDLVSKNYFANLNTQITNNPSLPVSIYPTQIMTACTGFRSNLSQVQSMAYCDSPFVSQFFPSIRAYKSFVEKTQIRTNKAITIFNFSHTDLFKMPHQKNTDAEWMQLIHGTNVANKFSPVIAPSWVASELTPLDPVWFKEWAGFDLPSPTILHQTFKSI